MRNLFEWKQSKLETFREQLKDQIREGFDVNDHFLFTTQEIEEIKEEVLIEDYRDLVEDFDEVNLDDDEIEISETPQYSYEFEPSEDGMKIDLEMEVNLKEFDLSFNSIAKIRDSLFAEDYELEVIEEADRAKIIFKRSGGKIFKRKVCGRGMRLVGNKCLPQTGTQKSQERVKGVKLKRAKKAMGAGAKKKAMLKKNITSRRVSGRARNLSNTEN